MSILQKIKAYIKKDTVKVRIGEQTVFFVKKTKFRFIVNDIINAITFVIEKDEFFKQFKVLTIILEDLRTFNESDEGKLIAELMSTFDPRSFVEHGQVMEDEVDSGLFIIHLYMDVIVGSVCYNIKPMQELRNSPDAGKILKLRFREYFGEIKSNLYKKIEWVLKHEATHIEHLLKSNIGHVEKKNQARLVKLEYQSIELFNKIKSAGSKEIYSLHTYKKFVRATKAVIDQILATIYREGIAEYNSKNLFLDIQEFHRLYRTAYLVSVEQFRELDKILKKILPALKKGIIGLNTEVGDNYVILLDNLTIIFKKTSYTLGLHMVFTVKYALLIDDEKLFSLSLAKFIKLYEEACNKLDVRPLITLTSGRGIYLDYKNTLRMLHRAEKC